MHKKQTKKNQPIYKLMIAIMLGTIGVAGSGCANDPDSATVGGQIGQRDDGSNDSTVARKIDQRNNDADGTTDTGQDGQRDIRNGNQSMCNSEYEELDGATQTEFGTSSDQIWEWLGGDHTTTLKWVDDESTALTITIGRYGDDHETCVSNASEPESYEDLSIEELLATEIGNQEPIAAGTCGSALYESFSEDSNPQCDEQIVLKDVMITIKTGDVLLDDIYVGYLNLNDADTATMKFELPPTVESALKVKERFELDIVSSLRFELSVSSTGTTGRIVATDFLSNEGIEIVTDDTLIQSEAEALAMDLALANGEQWPADDSIQSEDDALDEDSALANDEVDDDTSDNQDVEAPISNGVEVATWQ